MDLGNTTTNLGYGMSRMPYRPNIKINKLHDDAHLPTYGSANAACADLYAYIDFDDATMVNKNADRCIMIQPHETVKVHTGLRMAPPEGWYIQGFARSGLSTKHGLAPVNAVPIIDQDYRGEIIIPLHNYSNIPQIITHGDRIAQMAVIPFWQADFKEVSELDETERGAGGFELPENSKKNKGEIIMAKYFYVYSIAGASDSIVKMFNTETGAVGEKSVPKDRIDGFVDGIKASGYQLNKELAEADVAEGEAKRILAEKMSDYHAARDCYSEKADVLKRVKAKYGIK